MANSRSNIYPVKLQGAERFLIKRKNMKIQILEDESYIKYADFDNCEVWLLNRTNNDELDPRIVNIAEVTESLFPSSIKFPKLLTHIYEKHPGITTYDPEGKVIDYEPDFDYEILTNNKENFSIHSYVCDKEKFKIIKQN